VPDACLTCAGTGEWRAGVPCRDCRPPSIDVAFAGREPAADPAARHGPSGGGNGPLRPDPAPNAPAEGSADPAPGATRQHDATAGATLGSLAEVLRRAEGYAEECAAAYEADRVRWEGRGREAHYTAERDEALADAARLRALALAVERVPAHVLLAAADFDPNTPDWRALSRLLRLLSGAPAPDDTHTTEGTR